MVLLGVDLGLSAFYEYIAILRINGEKKGSVVKLWLYL
jgi:hypothetical protein